LGQQIVFVASVALCEELCDEKRFRKFVGGPIVEIRYAVHDALFTAFENEPSWGIHHRIMAPLITETAVAGWFTEVRDCAFELTAKWRALSGGSSRVSAIGELNRLDLETTTLCLFGRKLNGLTGPEPAMIKAMDGATSEAMKRPTRPRFLNWLLYQSKFQKDSKAMRQYAAECLAYRKANPTDRKDLLYAMMNGKDPETGKSLSEQQVIDDMVSMPIGSSTARPASSPLRYIICSRTPSVSRKPVKRSTEFSVMASSHMIIWNGCITAPASYGRRYACP
jgi:cytochrome P450